MRHRPEDGLQSRGTTQGATRRGNDGEDWEYPAHSTAPYGTRQARSPAALVVVAPYTTARGSPAASCGTGTRRSSFMLPSSSRNDDGTPAGPRSHPGGSASGDHQRQPSAAPPQLRDPQLAVACRVILDGLVNPPADYLRHEVEQWTPAPRPIDSQPGLATRAPCRLERALCLPTHVDVW